jgi:hypothetical protein
MAFGLGFLAGMGSAARDINERNYMANLEAERNKNKATADLLHDFMLRDDVTPEVRQAALSSLMQFSQTPGMPGSKHRQSAMEGVLGAFNQNRQFSQPGAQQQREQGSMMSGGADALDASSGFMPGGDKFAGNMRAMGNALQEQAPPDQTRHGFLGADELAIKHGRAAGLQTGAMFDAMGGFGNQGGNNGMTMIPVPNGKGGISYRVIPGSVTSTRARYLDADGVEQTGFINRDNHTGAATDGNGRPVTPLDLVTRDGYMAMGGVDAASGAPTREVALKSDLATRGPVKQFVRKTPVRGETLTGDQTLTSFDPASGTVAPKPTVIGQKTNSDVARQRGTAGIQATQVGTDIKQRKFALDYDPASYPGGNAALPPGVPVVNGQPTGKALYTSTRQPGTILARGSAAGSVISQGENVAKMVEDPKNADLMGKVSGRVSDLLTEGPQSFGLKWVGPIGTNDTRLTELHTAVKSISDLLTTVHGRRAEEAAKNFSNTLRLVNSPKALAGALRQYTRIAQEIQAQSMQPTTPVTGGANSISTNAGPPTRSTGNTAGAETGVGTGSKSVTAAALRALAASEKKTYEAVKAEAVSNGYTVQE